MDDPVWVKNEHICLPDKLNKALAAKVACMDELVFLEVLQKLIPIQGRLYQVPELLDDRFKLQVGFRILKWVRYDYLFFCWSSYCL